MAEKQRENTLPKLCALERPPVGCVKNNMGDSTGLDASGRYEARYIAFL
jgi:hypothetical protein